MLIVAPKKGPAIHVHATIFVVVNVNAKNMCVQCTFLLSQQQQKVFVLEALIFHDSQLLLQLLLAKKSA